MARSDVPTSKALAKTLSAKSETKIAARTVRMHLSKFMGYKSSVPRAVPCRATTHINSTAKKSRMVSPTSRFYLGQRLVLG